MNYAKKRKTVLCFLLLHPFVQWGCTSGSTGPYRAVGSAPNSLLSEVDRTRAYVPLNEIKPLVEKPIKPESFTPPSKRSARQIGAAKKLIEDERFTEAAIELERALRYDPNHPDIHRALAVLHWQAGNGERAQAHAERTLALNSDDAVAHYYVGRRAAQRSDHAEAMTAFRTALLCSDLHGDPDVAVLCHFHLAQSLASEGYLEAALAQYAAYDGAASVRKDSPNPELAALLRVAGAASAKPKAVILERLGRPGEAADEFAPIVVASPDDGILCVRFATLLMNAERIDEALVAVRQTNSDHPDVLRLLSEIHKQRATPNEWIDDLYVRRRRRPDDSQLVLDLAEALLKVGRRDQVLQELDRFLREHPEDIDVRDRLATAQANRNNWAGALNTIAAGLRGDPVAENRLSRALDSIAANSHAVTSLLDAPVESIKDAPEAYVRGDLAERAGRVDQAERWFKVALESDREFVFARLSLAKLFAKAYRYQNAIEVVARSDPDVAEDARLERMLGELYERLDEREKTELHFRAAAQLDRSDVASMFALADIYSKTGRALQAQRQLHVLLQESPLHEKARERLAFMYWREGKIDDAAEQFEKLAELTDDAVIKAKCRVLLREFPPRDLAAYREGLLAVIAEHGGRASIWLDIADTHNGLTELDAIRNAYQEALNLDPESERAAMGLVSTLTRLLAYEQAIARLQALLPRRPNRHIWRERLIGLYWANQDFESALALAEDREGKSDLDDEARTRYRRRILETLRLMDRSAERIDWLVRWTKEVGDESEWAARLALAYQSAGQPEKAVPILERRLQLEPDDKEALRTLADALAAAGHSERAGQLALNWLFDDPENDSAIALLVTLLADNDRIDNANDLVRNRLLHTEYRETFQGLIIQFLQREERHDDGIEWIESLIDRVLELLAAINENRFEGNAAPGDNKTLIRLPNEPFGRQSLFMRLTSLRLQLAQQLIIMKKYREAEMQLAEWLGAARDSRTRYFYLRRVAACRQLLGEDARATDALERALAIALEDTRFAESLPGLNNDISYSWIDRGVRLDEAEPMIRYAVSRAPQQAAYLDSYGWLQYKRANFQEAKKWLDRAVRAMANDDPVLFDHMGDTLWNLGEKKKAIEFWTSAMKVVLEPGEDDFPSADNRRVRDTTQQKIDDAVAGKTPNVASLAKPVDKAEPESDNKEEPQQVN